jgi:hypothetical protein
MAMGARRFPEVKRDMRSPINTIDYHYRKAAWAIIGPFLCPDFGADLSAGHRLFTQRLSSNKKAHKINYKLMVVDIYASNL